MPISRPRGLIRHVGLGAALVALLGLAACGPVHPRWKNDSPGRITIVYFRDGAATELPLAPGAEGSPIVFYDFQKVQRIEIREARSRLGLKRADVLRLHDRCGHGFRCRIDYFGDGHLQVKAG